MKKEIKVTCCYNEGTAEKDISQIIQGSFVAFLKKELAGVASTSQSGL